MSAATRDRTTADAVEAWFNTYRQLFSDLARSQRDDYPSLLDYYADPTIIATGQLCVSAAPERMLQVMTDQIESLRAAKYKRTTTGHLNILPLNTNTALIDAAWIREATDRSTLARIGTIYSVSRMSGGWRITSIVVTDSDSAELTGRALADIAQGG